MKTPISLTQHYGQLLGLSAPWMVAEVKLELASRRVEIRLERDENYELTCPECGRSCPVYDHGDERRWRHLDTMQFETVLVARIPRVQCPEHKERTASVPWARPHGRFTLLFEAFAVSVLECCGTVKAASEILRVDWKTLDRIMKSAVERGLERRDIGEVARISLDEKHFSRKDGYASVMCDIDGGRVLEMRPHSTEEAGVSLLESLPDETLGSLEAVGMDMGVAFLNATRRVVPWVDIVHDKFHVKKSLNDAVDSVRRGDTSQHPELKRSRYLWLRNSCNWKEAERARFETLRKKDLATAKAYAIKELFDDFWTAPDAEVAEERARRWLSWALRSQIAPIVRVAKTIQARLGNLLTYFKHWITSAVAEGMNSKIQAIIAAARGLRGFSTLRTRVLFFCGKLELYPLTH